MRIKSFSLCIISLLVLLVSISCKQDIPLFPDPLAFSQDGGTYYQNVSISITSKHASAIHYTTDGSIPTKESPQYQYPIELDTTTRLSAIAVDTNGVVRQQKVSDYIIPSKPLSHPYLDVPKRTIYHVSQLYEYSKDGGTSWLSCEGPSQTLETLKAGDHVWVRHKTVSTDLHDLGEVLSTDGYDLVAGQAYVAYFNGAGIAEEDTGVLDVDFSDFTGTIVIPTLINRGTQDFTGVVTLEFYASEDPVITEEDHLFLSVSTNEFPLAAGATYGASTDGSPPTDASWFMSLVDFSTISYNTSLELEGHYYIGYRISEGQELLVQNNWTPPQSVDSIYFIPEDAEEIRGAFKIVNSWGIGGGWENIHDGAYYIPFDVAVRLELQIFYTLNNPEAVYHPSLLASFQIAHQDRSSCLVSVGIGDPEHPIMEKRLQSIFFDAEKKPVVSSTQNPYPEHPVVMDISEFAPYLDMHDVFLRIDNTSDITQPASISSFSIELYDEYEGLDSQASQTLDVEEGKLGTVAIGEMKTYTIETAGVLDTYQLAIAQDRERTLQASSFHVEERSLTEEEIAQLLEMQRQEAIPQERSLGGQMRATGLAPMSESQIRNLKTISSLGDLYHETLPSEVDLSNTQYFPPIGNQGRKGSCSAFSDAYYIHTYNEAREHGWNLSGAEWDNELGSPSESHLDKIMSPDFTYHLASIGPGSNHVAVISLLDRLGSATWKVMPYENVDDMAEDSYAYPWPSEDAFREAALYRSQRPNKNYFEENAVGYIELDSTAKVEVLQHLIASGYCLSTSIWTEGFFYGENSWIGEKDVISLDGASEEEITNSKDIVDHAQTIVGYQMGDAWDPENP
nr:chitobiase/beta-hexosaminidase C-terminal domain-containing protein [uncultured Sphaerochaeta sp.]